jgi:hypothetical protein
VSCCSSAAEQLERASRCPTGELAVESCAALADLEAVGLADRDRATRRSRVDDDGDAGLDELELAIALELMPHEDRQRPRHLQT